MFDLSKFVRLTVLSLLLVALLGLTLRYKIAFSLPWLDQKHLLHAHSHFAFTGWISQLLFILLYDNISKTVSERSNKLYQWLIRLNLLSAYGMLIGFLLQGYAPISIFFSTLSIAISYVFTYHYLKDTKHNKAIGAKWFRGSLIFNVLSSLGTYMLVYMMMTKSTLQNTYLASIYFFLHFQYNGWFFFACMGLFMQKILQPVSTKANNTLFYIFFASCVPAYFLSALWLPIPLWVYILVVVAALLQVLAWLYFIPKVIQLFPYQKNTGRTLIILAGIALTIKLFLQLGSTIPSLSQIAFGFRPIVIGYLHLVLLGVITLFLLGYIFHTQILPLNTSINTGLKIFTFGVIINELMLMTQGIISMGYVYFPYGDIVLFTIAIILVIGALTIFKGSLRQ